MWIRRFFHDAKNYVHLNKFQCKWRKRNQHNTTLPLTIFPLECVRVGKDTYGRLNIHYFGTDKEEIRIGNFCSIAPGVHFVLGGEHDYKRMCNYPFETIYSKFEVHEALSKGPIVIEDDVWIGLNAIILSGVTIGKGAVVGAGSIVTHNIPPYGIYYNGNTQKYRFTDEVIDALCQIDFSTIGRENYEKLRALLYDNVTVENINRLKSLL